MLTFDKVDKQYHVFFGNQTFFYQVHSALTSCATSMADTNIDAIKKNYKYNFYLVIEVPDHVYVLD